MTKIIMAAVACFVFLTGCQSAPEPESKPAAPAVDKAAVAPSEVEVLAKAPEADHPADVPELDRPDTESPQINVTQPAAPEAQPPAAGSEETAGEESMNLKNGLAHHNFVLETVDGQKFTYPVPEGETARKPNFSFGQWPHASGKICNGFSGQVELDGDTLHMRNAASTMMLCFAEELNKLEGLFHQMLNGGVKVTLDGPTLTLTGDGHVLVFTLRDYVS